MNTSDIYLDNAATTAVLPEVAAAVHESLTRHFGNPSSIHTKGIEAERLVKAARRQVAAALGAGGEDILFTSGGTEGNNLAIFGTAFARQGRGRHIITTKTEHSSVLSACRRLESEGFRISYVPVDDKGHADPEQIGQAISDDTILVSVSWVNNEIGTINRLADIVRLVKDVRSHIIIHTDAVQAFTKIPIDVEQVPVDLLTISGHKIHAPKGIGALYVRPGLSLTPLFFGGGQERGVRPGTENVPGIVGFGTAVKHMVAMMGETSERLRRMRDETIRRLLSVEGSRLNGRADGEAAPHIVNVSFAGVPGEVLVRTLASKGVFVSSGSACSSKKTQASHVIQAIEPPSWALQGAIRLSFSSLTQEAEVERALDVIIAGVEQLRRRLNWKGGVT